MTDDKLAVLKLGAELCTGYLSPEVPHNYSFNDDDLLAFVRAIEARVLEELRKQEPVASQKYWLIERQGFYWTGVSDAKHGYWIFSRSHMDAVRFPTRAAATICRSSMWLDYRYKEEPRNGPIEETTITEHISCSAPIPPNSAFEQECKDADELLRLLNLDPEIYRTECGFINLPKVKAALKYPNDYPLLNPAAPIPPTEVEPATEYAEYILDHYDRKSRKDRKLLGKHLAEWADRRYRDAAPIPPTVTPSQQKVLSAVDTLLATFDSGYHPELNLIRDFMLARPDAPIPTTGETK